MSWIIGQLVALETPAERRGEPRVQLCLDLPAPGIPNGLVRVLDLSASGMMIHCEHRLEPEETLLVEIPGRGTITATIVWRRQTLMGCRFAEPLSRAAIAAIRLRAPPALPRDR